MTIEDAIRLILGSIWRQRLRSALTVVGIVIGIASVVLLSSIGQGTRQGIARQFSQFGTTLVAITPGKSETFGVSAMLGSTRKLSLEDALALRRVRGVREMTCTINGSARVEFGERGRDVYVYGTLAESTVVWKWNVRIGQFLPAGDPRQTPAVCVLGSTLSRELFGADSPLGKKVRIGGTRFVVIGIMESKGRMLGFDLDDAAYVPVVRAMRLFNQHELHEIHLDAAGHEQIDLVADGARKLLIDRHGEEDFTLVTQAAMMEVIDNVLDIITRGVVAIAGIAIFVGAVGILTVTWVSVHERTGQIGLMKAIGASNQQVVALFLGEATMLAAIGGFVGVLLGLGGGLLLQRLVPGMQVEITLAMLPAYVAFAGLVGAASGWLPARRAASMDPVTALRED